MIKIKKKIILHKNHIIFLSKQFHSKNKSKYFNDKNYSYCWKIIFYKFNKDSLQHHGFQIKYKYQN